jgi:ABC-type branched-subunit amino acid transport system substrate-binding protein
MAAAIDVAFLTRPDGDADALHAATRRAADLGDQGADTRVVITPALTADAIAAIVHGDLLDDPRLAGSLEQADIPVIVFAGARRGATIGRRTFFLGGGIALEGETAVRHLRIHGVRRWALLAADCASGHAYARAAERAIGELGGALTARHVFAPQAPQLDAGLVGAARAGVEAVFLAATPASAADRAALAQAALLAMRRARLPGLLHLPGVFADDDALPQALARDGEGAIAATCGSAARHAETAVGLLAELIAQVGADARRLTDALARLRGQPSAIGPIGFDERGENTGAGFEIRVIDGGSWLRWEASDYALGLRRLPGVLG